MEGWACGCWLEENSKGLKSAVTRVERSNCSPSLTSFRNNYYTLHASFQQLLAILKIRQIHKYLFVVPTKYSRSLLTFSSKHLLGDYSFSFL